MAQWQAKAPAEVVERRWSVPLAPGDTIGSFDLTASGVTAVVTGTIGRDAVVTLSGGTAGTVGSVLFTLYTGNNLTLQETFYIPVQATANQTGNTVRDVCQFALRPIVGVRRTATAAEIEDARERLQDMLAAWAAQGADTGITLPIALSDTLYVEDAWLTAIKNNLVLELMDLYGKEPSGRVIQNARSGLALVKAARLPKVRLPYEYDERPDYGTGSITDDIVYDGGTP